MGRKDKAKMKKKQGDNEKEEVKVSARDSIAATGSRNKNEVKVINDDRFVSMHSDPRFQAVPNQLSKVTIDKRFKDVLSKGFSSSSARVDKRGKTKNMNSENPLRHYYRQDEEENKKNDQESDDDDENEKSGKNEKAKVQKHDRKILKSDSDSESEETESADELSDDTSSSTGSDTDEDDAGYLEDVPEEPEENIPVIEQETRRLAIVNMDWSQVRAADLFVVMSSFLPKSGKIVSIAVYPSEFGLKRMEEEAVKGPVGLFDDGKEKSDDDDDDGDDEIDEEKLRAYEKSRLRYYYAVVECDSSDTADYLYKNCDGIEFERTSNVLDLRFIPDSMEFKHPPRDIATEGPTNYEGIDFQTRALQHSNLELTWDEDEPQRIKALKRTFNADQLAESEMNAYLASDVSDDDDDEDEIDAQDDQSKEKLTKAEKYRVLFEKGDEGSDGGDDDEDGNKDMEVTFNTGLEDLSKRILEKKKDKESETVWNQYLRKKSEKKKARKNFSKHSSEDESSGSGRDEAEQDDFFIDESSVKFSKRGKNNRKEKQLEDTEKEHEASKAELELLLADDQEANNGLKGYNIKRNKAKGKKGNKEDPSEDKIPAADYTDPRFQNLYKSPLFALDPTDPQYKRSAAYARQVGAQKQNGVHGDLGNGEELTPQVQLSSDNSVPGKKVEDDLKSEEMPSSSKKEKLELSSLVRSLKRKSQQAQIPSSSDKRSRKNSESKPHGISSNNNEDNGLSSMKRSSSRRLIITRDLGRAYSRKKKKKQEEEDLSCKLFRYPDIF
ncbi:hypothetical protein C5167_038126 [Papaver somniferum]|uniref:Uncharacterized protein n=1 Tax=Papaver somniferum TaxID=3469 RepID=A0A4Y7ICD9_PAPSO|nr:hypothetical protein C5167_038126 [Papaver somniferum]